MSTSRAWPPRRRRFRRCPDPCGLPASAWWAAQYGVDVKEPRYHGQPLGWLKSFKTRMSIQGDEVLFSITVYAKDEQVTFQVRVARREGVIHIEQQSSDGNSKFHYYVLGK